MKFPSAAGKFNPSFLKTSWYCLPYEKKKNDENFVQDNRNEGTKSVRRYFLCGFQTSDELLRIRREQEQMYNEQWLDNLSAVILGTSDVTRLEDEIIKLLEEKYDSIRQKVLQEALRDQIGLVRCLSLPCLNLLTSFAQRKDLNVLLYAYRTCYL